MKVSDILRILRDDGWHVVRTKGSHWQLKHAYKKGTVTVTGKGSVEIPPGTLKNILKQAGLDQ